MKATKSAVLVGRVLAVFFLASSFASAQQSNRSVAPRAGAYDLSRETVLQGTIVSSDAGSASTASGAQIKLNTSSGIVNVDLGNPKLLALNNLSLAAGDAVRLTGENIVTPSGTTVFAARIVQKGSQSLTVRSMRGFALRPLRGNVPEESTKRGGVL